MDNKQNINDKIDQAIFESEEETKNGAKPISASEAKRMFD